MRGAKAVCVVLGILTAAGCSSASSGGGQTDSGTGFGQEGGSGSGSSSGASGSSSGGSGSSSGGGIHCDTSGGPGVCTCIVRTSSTLPPSPAGTCPGSTQANPHCCAQTGWPNQMGAECQCSNYACSETAALCTCSIDTSPGAAGTQSSCMMSHTTCCQHTLSDGTVDSCSCTNFACQTGDTPVPSCSVSILTCIANGTKVQTCQ
jgi:hypothetical protein